MTYVFDIIHPAHAHFFAHAIRTIRDRGDRVMVFSRGKEFVANLLDAYGIQHTVLSRARTGVLGLGTEMLIHQGKLLAHLLGARPRVITALGGPLCAHVGRLLCPVVVFTDTHMAYLQNRITFPFVTHLVVPESFPGPYYGAEARAYPYPGYHELAYLRPDRFTPDPGMRAALGLSEGERLFLVRFTAWKSSHDFGVSGLDLEQKRQVIGRLRQAGRVFITSESGLPPDLAGFAYPLPPDTIHHAIAAADLVVGESATMASEAAVLGVRGVFISPIGRCYTDDQERRYDLAATFHPGDFTGLMERLEEWLTRDDRLARAAARQRLLADTIDVTGMIVAVLTAAANRQPPPLSRLKP